ncbi:MAG: hypothetical protein U0800_26110 [Isosphaeraceae bacterium]
MGDPRGTYWAATPQRSNAGLVVDELADPDDEGKPLYLLPADVLSTTSGRRRPGGRSAA